ncbi:MAG: hypothetical protein EBT83_06095 [Betaproteobacteria bacterium]|nr:hypothetical protein [Betaproteobacteria bacterium]
MKLSHYLLLGLAAMFAAILVGAQLLYVNDTRNYLEQQLEAHAEETATSLALALGSAGGPADRTLAETVVRPVFDRGQFRRIEVRDVNGASMVRMELGVQPSDAPAWFVSLFAIEASGGEALISSGWKQSGRVTVEPLPALAYRHLWEVAQSSAIGLAVLFALAVGLSMVFLNFLLRSLDELEAAARDLGNRVFREISLAPRARELQSLVNAFNVLMVASTAAAPLISPFIIACDGSEGFSEIPPESYITPLPTSTRCGLPFAPVGLYVRRTMRGGSTLPRFTPTIPPQPIASN